MKRFKISLIIISTIFIFLISWLFYLDYQKDYLVSLTDKALFAAQNDNNDETVFYIGKIREAWSNLEQVLIVMTRHQHLEAIELAVISLEEYYRTQEEGEFTSNLEEIKSSIEHIYRSEFPHLYNLL